MNILDKIIATKREEVAALKRTRPLFQIRQSAASSAPTLGFRAALAQPGGPHLIAEVKKASPSKGLIRADFDPVAIARAYERGGAVALSVLTDVEYFQGSLAFLRDIHRSVRLPLLRKDFIIDEAQIFEAREAGASAILLIAAALEPLMLKDLHATARETGLDVLVEVHSRQEIDALQAVQVPVEIWGVNNRDLRTFTLDLRVTEELAGALPAGSLLVSESGIFTPEDLARVARAGARVVLVGESLMRHHNIEAATRQLLSGSPTCS